MAKTLEQLLSLSTIIANETKAGANTALRVGGLFSDIIYYLRDLDYADKEDIPSLEGYATEQWVLGKGYATTSDLDTRIDALVNGAPAAYDTLKEIADVLAGNVNSISDILTALGNKADKATTLSGYGITDAYTITQIDNIVNGLSGNISTLQGYFTDGVANSALRLSDNGSYTAWGQTFFANGKPKSVSGALTDVTDITSSGTITTNKIVIGNGTIEWDEANKGFKVTGLYSTTYLSAKGDNTNGGSTPSGGGLITSLYRYADLGKTFSDTSNDTFNAYTINKINTDLGSRISVLEGKATNVSFTQSLTSGTQIGSISIDGVTKNIYAPTIPTDDINKGVTAYGWGNHASVGYAMASALGDYQTKITSSNKLDYSLISGVPTKLSQFTNDLGLGTFAYKSSLAFSDLTDKPTTISGYGITDAYTKTQVDSALGGYLPLSGGTIEIITDEGLSVNRTNGTRALISFKVDGGYKGGLGIDTDGVPLYRTYAGGINTLIHSGNIGSQSVDNADKVDGYHVKASNTPFDGIPIVRSDGVMEIGKYIDFHNDNTTGNDYDCRLDIQGGNKNIVHLPSTSGTLALLTDNVASATKLQTARTIWGQSFDGTGNVGGNLHLDNSKIYWHSDSANYYIDNYYDGTNFPLMRYMGYSGHRFMTSSGEIMRITYSGNVGIGTTSPQYKLDVNGALNAGVYYASITNSIGKNTSGHFRWGKFDEVGGLKLQFGAESGANLAIINSAWNKALFVVDTEGNVTASGTIHSNIGIFSDGYVSAKGQNTSSDMRLKNVLNEVVLGVKDIANAPSMRFAWKNGGGVDVGSSAQYWQGVLPDAVKEMDKHLEMQYGNIALLSAIAIAKRVETHEERIARLEKENKELRNEINSLRYGA